VRIFRAVQSPQDRPWFCTITARVPQQPADRGYTPSLPGTAHGARYPFQPIDAVMICAV
jgi:hypothetical protein